MADLFAASPSCAGSRKDRRTALESEAVAPLFLDSPLFVKRRSVGGQL
jgi:hypothetical protein